MKITLFIQTVFIICLFCVSSPLPAEVIKPIEWKYSFSKDSFRKGDTIDIIFYARIQSEWYLYSSDFDKNLGPLVTEFSFISHSSFTLIGGIRAIQPFKKYDSLFGGEYTYFENTATFKQTLLVKDLPLTFKGNIQYQVCSHTTHICVTLEEEFTEKHFIDSLGKTSGKDENILSFLLLCLFAGLSSLFTPCVFPMIPLTVSYFTKKRSKYTVLGYGISIILIYTFIGILLAPFMGAEMANELATGWFFNILFFVVFLLFGFSLLGYFELVIPYRFVNAIETKTDKGGFVGILFIALSLVLVSFSCTVPLVGSILIESVGILTYKPILGMLSFAMGVAVPFTLFAFFPNVLRLLPKSGSWLNTIKVCFGVIELAFSFKFLSIADQAYHWNILDREIYLIIWIVLFALLGFYFFGKIKFPHDGELQNIGFVRFILGIVTFVFVLYLFLGLLGNPLKALSGYLPPLIRSDVSYNTPQNNNISSHNICESPLYSDVLHFPHNLAGYFDYQQALSCSKAKKKPIFINFTGHGCVNCREMEARVWDDPRVLTKLQNDFILLSLFVDDKTELPESKWYISENDKKQKKNIGQQNMDFQITRYNSNGQPLYVIIDENENMLTEPSAYNLDVEAFITFLNLNKHNF
ncbi:MAG: protein-disulfide reductase DsbD family protein [Chitinophagaceae bacterium]|nr:protein-disulfide reductase DsbD family protein [Chitinophagaceae bacterium]